MSEYIDRIDAHILRELQRDAGQSQRELAERIGLSQNATWRRVRLLEERGIVTGRSVRIDREKLGFGLVVFAMVRTRNHSGDWLKRFRTHVTAIPEVIDFYRIGGEYDYLLKIVTRDMNGYDHVYQRLIENVELETVTSSFAMEAICESRPISV